MGTPNGGFVSSAYKCYMLSDIIITLPMRVMAKYCDECVCLSVCLC